jgi:pimeloyl-ACP methyl ester carboxylesterase
MRGHRRALAVSALAAGGAAAAAQARHRRRIGADPAGAALNAFVPGRPLAVTSADGTSLHAEVFGPDEAPTIVLAHGWTEGISYWALVIDQLKRDFRIVAYDLRGHGRSARAARGDYSLERFGDDVEAVLEAAAPLGGRVAVVAGHSLGAMSITAWAERYDVDARASAAALMFTGLSALIAEAKLFPPPLSWAARYSNAVARRGFLGARRPIPALSTPVHEASIRYLAFGPHATPATVEFYRRLISGCPVDVRAACGLALADMDLTAALSRLTIPTLVMAGDRDRLTPPVHASRIAAALPKLARMIVLPETGHMGPLERPAEVAAALRELAADVAAPRSGRRVGSRSDVVASRNAGAEVV